MTTLLLERPPCAVRVTTSDEYLIVELSDRRCLSVPLDWYPRLAHANDSQRRNYQILGEGYAIEWPDLDEHVGIEGLLAGRRSGESQASFERWLNSRSQ
ncbi:MAG TPA: DUF2442 domain-containing protein [Pirellulales bacterium]